MPANLPKPLPRGGAAFLSGWIGLRGHSGAVLNKSNDHNDNTNANNNNNNKPNDNNNNNIINDNNGLSVGAIWEMARITRVQLCRDFQWRAKLPMENSFSNYTSNGKQLTKLNFQWKITSQWKIVDLWGWELKPTAIHTPLPKAAPDRI